LQNVVLVIGLLLLRLLLQFARIVERRVTGLVVAVFVGLVVVMVVVTRSQRFLLFTFSSSLWPIERVRPKSNLNEIKLK
jgi:MFS superfamily sulfate permease-like transporter